MERQVLRRAATLAAAATIAGLSGAAGAEQGFQQPSRQQQQQQQDQYEQQRQREMQQQFEWQERQMEQEQLSQREQQLGRQIERGAAVVIGVDSDQDGEADAVYFVPASVVQQLAREHRNVQRPGMRSMQLRPWQNIQQASLRGEGDFEDLPLTDDHRGPGATGRTHLSGIVMETRTARLAGQGHSSQLAKLRLQDGGTVFADLGPAQHLRGVRLSPGEQVSVEGTAAWLNNQPVIFADRIQTRQGVMDVGPGPRHMFGPMGPRQHHQQQRQRQPQQQGQWQQQGEPWDMELRPTGMGQEQRLRGRVIDADEVTIGDSEPYLFVELRASDGATGWVCLGPAMDVQDLDINRNDQLTVFATPIELQGETVYYASQVQADGDTMIVQQEEGGRRGPRLQRAGMGQLQQLRGTVTEMDELTIGNSEPYLFVRLRAEGGPSGWVNLGPLDQVRDLDINVNDRITVLAHETDLHGETVFHARQVQASGRSARIQQTALR